jgi:transposase InsO family protein
VAIAYYLQKLEETDPLGRHLPTSTSTIWEILDQNQRILRPIQVPHEPTLLAAPLTSWQIDFKDVTTVAPEPDGKRQHAVESLNMIDTGTSILVDNPLRTDFNAETVIDTLVQTLQQVGCPRQITFDRDPRFVGGAGTPDFPAAFVRFLTCLNIQAEICPPQRPDKNGFAERYNRTYEYEGIRNYRPATFEQAREIDQAVRQHCNFERPNQARSCGNQPPPSAFPDLPTLPGLPQVVDPDGWLKAIDGRLYIRRVNHSRTVKVDKRVYYIGRDQHGQHVVLHEKANEQQFQVELKDHPFKVLPIKGLQHQLMSFNDYLTFIRQQAVPEWRQYLGKARVYVRLIT